jgi:hypothetical protein
MPEPMAELSKLKWLKRTHGYKFTGAELRVLLSIFNHSGADGRNAHPGVKRMVDETGYSRAAVSLAVSSLKDQGWITETYRGNGVSGNASVFDLVPDAPNPPSMSSGVDQPTEVGMSTVLDQLPVGMSTGLTGMSSGVDEVRPVGWTPSDPGTDPLSDLLGDPFDRPSDPGEVHHPVNHLGITETTSGLGDMPKDKTAELSPKEDEPESESEPWESVSFFGIPDPAPAEHFTPWPVHKPLPEPRDPFTTYVDQETGEPLPI